MFQKLAFVLLTTAVPQACPDVDKLNLSSCRLSWQLQLQLD